MDLHYLLYDLADYYLPRLTSRAPPPSQIAILVERCCINRESALSSSRRLPTSFGGPLGFLRAPSWAPGVLSRRPETAPRAVWGLLFRLPTSSSIWRNVPKRIGAIAFATKYGQMGLRVLYIWILEFRPTKMAYDTFWGRLGALLRLSWALWGRN